MVAPLIQYNVLYNIWFGKTFPDQNWAKSPHIKDVSSLLITSKSRANVVPRLWYSQSAVCNVLRRSCSVAIRTITTDNGTE